MRKQLGTSKVEVGQDLFTALLGSDARDHLIGQRDMLVGLWASKLLGLPEESRAMYAMEVMAAGLLESEPEDVVDKSRAISPSGAFMSPEGRSSFRSVRNIDWRWP
jgi:hypothetical protein